LTRSRSPPQFLGARGVELEQARHEDIEAFIADQLARWSLPRPPNRYRSLRVFYGWLEAEGEIPVSPMAKMRPPAVPDQPVPLVREDAFRRLLEASAGRDFEARRDTALACSWSTWPAPRRDRRDAPHRSRLRPPGRARAR
jgi:site-specific recombinase XerD